jgi:protein-S-isoprenylcysteine O-methyltransferase Ste14
MRFENRSYLIIRTLLVYLFSLFFIVLLIFVPAGSLKFWNGWLFMGALFIPMLFIPALLIIRIRNEEKVLVNGLKGYDEYMKKVKYRRLPFIW